MRALRQRYGRILGETAWVLLGQGLSALATLAGLRLITEFVPPQVYGTVVLASGVVTLAHGLAAVPLTQAVLRFYPDVTPSGDERLLRQVVLKILRLPTALGVAALAALAAGWAAANAEDLSLAVLAPALLVAEVARSVELVFMNASRQQRAMSLLLAADAWMRPLAAVGLVWAFGASPTVVIGGYVAGCALVLACFRFTSRPREAGNPHTGQTMLSPVSKELSRRMWVYALPLVGLPFVEWLSGQGSRYLLGAIDGVAAVGAFAAIHGLASRPFLILSSALELVMRPPYYARVSADDDAGERKAFLWWLTTIFGGSTAMCIVIVFFHAEIAGLVLAAEYRVHSELMGWIAAGYILLACCWMLQRSVCYAHHDTRGALWVETLGAAFGLAFAAPLIWRYGIEGAAWAAPFHFGVQLLLAGARARHVWRRSRQRAPFDN